MYQWNLTVEFGPVHLEAANKVKAALAQLGVADVDDMGDANECVINGLVRDGEIDEFKPLPVARIIEPLLLPHQLPWSNVGAGMKAWTRMMIASRWWCAGGCRFPRLNSAAATRCKPPMNAVLPASASRSWK